ncbi:F-box protein At3g07870-like [Salvia hispanica]|uniref:F-box protein At3g07870-like n=1 Tax=Salvia hispanica TaxID=49212 RepID=UPI0020098C1B|nr:F-box protein At3g07870-like [Salvia hispanica]XP_047953326.1 F-box protein At3g07870-like [Salvia hispanica]XP_047953328.1 F-box protein At3g07870-like [Salvia hispanica]XP_047966412.1 F-box protein At3g07870-like [Salvia hispanica]XP_047966413.1 F-box protein At3g07870-like [Salvia hispanica]XP_047966414.1 F-box protein At3g07870-like [Salvia hispanica]
MKKMRAKSEIGENLFLYLPSEMIIDILSRLDVRTAMRGKCVCKPWLDLLTTPEFVKAHLSKSISRLIITERVIHITDEGYWNYNSETHKMVDELNLNCDWHSLNKVFNLDLPFRMAIQSSINGLLLEHSVNRILCNPITREYIKLPCPRQPSTALALEFHGFGVSRVSGQYKVVRISAEGPPQTPVHLYSGEAECQVYTLGTGLWRRIGQCGHWKHLADNSNSMKMSFLCGYLHWWWRSTAISAPTKIYRLDLETECFSTFSCPRAISNKERHLSSLRGCLCVCDNSNLGIIIWVMKEYGNEKSWSVEFSILKDNTPIWDGLQQLNPIEVFKNGDMLLSWRQGRPIYYSSTTKAIQEVDLHDSEDDMRYQISLYTPSLLSLKTFATENVISF